MTSKDDMLHAGGARVAGCLSNTITEKELTECDVEPVHLLAQIQGDCGHVLFFEYPGRGRIVAHDAAISNVPWVTKVGAASSASASAAPAAPAAVGSVDQQHASTTPDDDDDDDDDDEDDYDDTTPPPTRYTNQELRQSVPPDLFGKIWGLAGQITPQRPRDFLFYSYQDAAYAITVSRSIPEQNPQQNPRPRHGPTLTTLAVEIEKADVSQTTKFSSTVLHLSNDRSDLQTQHEIAATACDMIYRLVNHYDRGMVYKFHDDLSGEVIHEIKNDTTQSSYLGMRFPASDIPLTSRQLYIKNGVRYIRDVDTPDVPVLSLFSDRKMDLTHIRMRAVNKPHAIYLRNLGLRSTLSLAMVVEDELWGLLAFHCYKPQAFQPSLYLRLACETISSVVSIRLQSQMKKMESMRLSQLGDYTLSLQPDKSLIDNLFNWGDGILKVMEVDVLVAHILDPREGEGDMVLLGDSKLQPLPSFWDKMKLQPARELCVASSKQEVQAKFDLSETECPAAGIVFFQEGRTQVLLARGTRLRDVVWGGKPDEPKLKIGGILHPRASFAKYTEKARHESRAWTTHDVSVIQVLRDRICEHSYSYMMGLLRHNIEDANRKYLAAVERAQDNYEFFAHMSHELRTPFHGVMGSLRIIQESVEQMTPAEIREVADTAIASGNHMIKLLNDILDVSKNKHLSHITTKDRVIYQSLAFEAIDGMKSLALTQGINVSSTIVPASSDPKLAIVTDRTKVIQIVTNIMSNAIKFTTSDGVINVGFQLLDNILLATKSWSDDAESYAGAAFTMKKDSILVSAEEVQKQVESYRDVSDQKWMVMMVADSGCGMHPNELVDMFAPYTQSSFGSNRSFQGTGLGLFICVSLCYQLNGFIACASTPDRGTVFRIGIPVSIAAPSPDHEAESVLSKGDRMKAPEQIPMRGPILIVDDNVVNVKILKRQLEMAIKKANKDLAILVGRDGTECVAIFKENRPALCIIDYHMPSVNGLEATVQIREFEAAEALPRSHILIYTADATDQVVDIAMAAGVDEIMTKPAPKDFIAFLVERMKVM